MCCVHMGNIKQLQAGGQYAKQLDSPTEYSKYSRRKPEHHCTPAAGTLRHHHKQTAQCLNNKVLLEKSETGEKQALLDQQYYYYQESNSFLSHTNTLIYYQHTRPGRLNQWERHLRGYQCVQKLVPSPPRTFFREWGYGPGGAVGGCDERTHSPNTNTHPRHHPTWAHTTNTVRHFTRAFTLVSTELGHLVGQQGGTVATQGA